MVDEKQYNAIVGRMNDKDFWVMRERGRTFHRFFFIDPEESATVVNLATALINLREVQEIIVDEISAGFVVKARFKKDRLPDDVTKYMNDRINEKFGKV